MTEVLITAAGRELAFNGHAHRACTCHEIARIMVGDAFVEDCLGFETRAGSTSTPSVRYTSDRVTYRMRIVPKSGSPFLGHREVNSGQSMAISKAVQPRIGKVSIVALDMSGEF